jgi:plastocyanin
LTALVRPPAPARLLSQLAGAVVLCWLCAGCDRTKGEPAAEQGPRVLQLDSTSIALPDSVHLAVITLDRSIRADMDRLNVELRVGDIIRFETRDGGGHAIAFDGVALATRARVWLEHTGQLRSPPLVAAGNAWVVSFEEAPPGDYPFQCVTHGGRGTVRVTPR